MPEASTHTTRCIRGLRRRAAVLNDDYLSVCADEMERVYNIMVQRGRLLQEIADKVETYTNPPEVTRAENPTRSQRP